ncbi:thymidine kinase [Piscinibacter sakaiensis]|uniref:Thymidine kinase n=1 Tax=Piscinibacter sakaiensis TaxID=1547922 RepID=A0A0K8P668_PISS1|nr:thymidine kinase [Piscinibacter sakaiensis]GAP38097.1 thymidine kinase [Piscinibacter sakaiensis]
MAKLYFRYAAMNAGKSTALLQVAYNYEERGMAVRLFTAALDVRAGRGVIASRLGLAREADTFGPDTVFTRAPLGDVACLLIDEAQFLSVEQVRQLHRLAHVDHLPVMCYGLRSDFRTEAFPGAAALLTLADDIEEMKSICACGRKATLNLRIDVRGQRVREGEQVDIGGNERYRAVCPACYYQDEQLGPDAAPGLFG